MSLADGTRLGAYEVTGQIGAGGMGEVYRATDTKLGRDVAIKTLPAALASDEDRLARFEREAKLLAGLNHPHIASVYSLDEHDGTLYLAMELVEGETLEERLKPGALPIEDALRLALQIAEALEAAHDKGVVHRDLKPANVMVTQDGIVKVLDFGLAKAFSEDPAQSNAAQSPALSVAMTQQGLVLGTAGYMSPEQASGQPTNQRADIWAFGVVLYEMLTGLPLFAGESVPHILADVLKTEPDWSRLPDNLHPRLKFLLERCLTKKPKDRYSGIADARVDIQAVLSDPSGALLLPTLHDAAHERPLWRLVLAAIVISGIFGGSLGYFGSSGFGSTETPHPSYRFSIPAPTSAIRALSVSPDGQYVAFISYNADNRTQIFLRDLESETYRAIAGTEDLPRGALFWSPDSEAIAFVMGNQLMRVGISGLPPEPMLDVESLLPAFGNILGGDWSQDGTILLGTEQGIVAVLPSGETFNATDGTDSGLTHSFPTFLPDGQRFVYLASSANETGASDAGIYIGTLDPDDPDRAGTRILRSDSPVILVEEGGNRRNSVSYLLYERDGQLLARRFEPESDETGEEFAIAQTTPSSLTGLIARPYSASMTGSLVYLDSDLSGEARLVWYDREGNTVGQFEEPRDYRGVRFSSGGNVIVTGIQTDDGEVHPWYSDIGFPRWTRVFTDDDALASVEISTSGILAASVRVDGGAVDVFGGMLGQTALTSWWTTPYTKHVNDISTDGSVVVWDEHVAPGNQNLSLLEISSDGIPAGEAIAVADTVADESFGQFSPDDQWIAYDSNEEGPYEVYIKPVILEGRLMAETRGEKVSSQGGRKPRWSADGRELYYLSADRKLMAVEVDTNNGQLVLGTPEALFEHPRVTQFMPWGVSNDGRFLFTTSSFALAEDPIHIYVNWTELAPN